MKKDQDQVHYPLSNIPYDTSSLAYDQRAIHREQQQSPAHEASDLNKINGSIIQLYFDTEVAVEQSLRDRRTEAQGDHMHGLPAKWMSSKMRLMRKMMGDEPILISKQGGQVLQECSSSSNGNNSPTGIVRVCSNCSTTKTPLWRSGPQGPKSLCNACGIRQMKARRAMRAAAAISGGLVPASAPKKALKGERLDVDRTVPFKKRFKIATSSTAQNPFKKRFKIASSSTSQKKLRFDDVTISLSKKLAFQQTFPQEEKDAAILLMALSCGLIHG